MTGTTKAQRKSAISIEYSDLISMAQNNSLECELVKNILEKIEKAFGSDDECLGILAITGIPGVKEKRKKLLPLAYKLANLSPADLDEIVVPESFYTIGWSHGKEKLQGDTYDLAKGSFYANPLSDDFLSDVLARSDDDDDNNNNNNNNLNEENSVSTNEQVALHNSAIFVPNVWPSQLPELESSFKDMGLLIHEVGLKIARACDLYFKKHHSATSCTKIEEVLKRSLYCKGRLLHYFPKSSIDQCSQDYNKFSDWCGWHNDFGSITGLVPGMFLDETGMEITCPDVDAGLYIRCRGGDTVHVQLPSDEDCLAFQIGETTQIQTGGILQATPHAVKGCNVPNVSRESFAVFIEPEYGDKLDLPCGRTVEDAQDEDKAKLFLPDGVATLKSRWEPGMNFGEFTEATVKAFS